MAVHTLYELTEELVQIERYLEGLADDPDGTKASIQAYLQSLTEGELSQKLEGYVKLMRSIEAEAEALKAEAKAFAEASKVRDNRHEALKDRLKWFLTTTNRTEAKAGLFKVALQDNGGMAPMLEPKEPDLMKIPTLCIPDKAQIRQKLEAGGTVPGYSLGERGQHVRVKL